MQKLNHIHRGVVRAAMNADGWKFVGEFNRYPEENGSYVFVSSDFDPNDLYSEIMVCTLYEDYGDIEIGAVHEFNNEFIYTIVFFPGYSLLEKLTARYPLRVPLGPENGPAQRYMEEYQREILNGMRGFPSQDEWIHIQQKCIEAAESNNFERSQNLFLPPGMTLPAQELKNEQLYF